MQRVIIAALVLYVAAFAATATVIVNEVFLNPPGSSADDTREFIELLGTPGMKLDGYAVALVNGGLVKYYPLNSIPPRPVGPEVDELSSLDGLQLGANGILVLGIGNSSYYPTLLADSNFQQWTGLWNGGLDVPGKLNNDGSNTVLLLRNRPGRTRADPANPGGLRWGKDIVPDDELFRPIIDPNGVPSDQYGDGAFDYGQPSNISGNTLDLVGKGTLADVADDLEIVDELSYEHDQGWEYDTDDRHVDDGSTHNGLPRRHVHALDDPQGFNPDALARVDYRTKGAGWTPAPGALGELPNGNNWQDTATQQWIRGECVNGTSGQGSAPWFYFSNAANTNPDAIQPYVTNVPQWLNDGAGADYGFAGAYSYQLMAGRVNPLAVALVPGDVDRDGDCDADDIAKVAAVFGDDDWIFSNAYAEAPAGNAGDPAAQTRPWDVDETGDNGIEASDLQWVLNFQGNANGRIVGRRYDSTTPSATGVYLNSNAAVGCTVSRTVSVPSGHALTALLPGDIVEINVLGAVSSGANTTPGQENGIMQFAHDVTFSAPGVAQIVSVTALGSFTATRTELETLVGSAGDLGVQLINGHTTGYSAGIGGAAALYRVTLRAIGVGSTQVAFAAAAETKFSASTPRGLKVGHTDHDGNPASAGYPAVVSLTVIPGSTPGDLNCDGSVGFGDINPFVLYLSNFAVWQSTYAACPAQNGDINSDGTYPSFGDINPFVALLSGGGGS
jgi:hypothetical protein